MSEDIIDLVGARLCDNNHGCYNICSNCKDRAKYIINLVKESVQKEFDALHARAELLDTQVVALDIIVKQKNAEIERLKFQLELAVDIGHHALMKIANKE